MDLITKCNLFSAVNELNEAVENNLSCCKKSLLEQSLLYSKILWLTSEGEDTSKLYKLLYNTYGCAPISCSDTIIKSCVITTSDITPIITCTSTLVITNIPYETY
jgi:hypothetical protein